MKKTLIPKWAPEKLVNIYNQMKEEIDSGWKFYEETDKDELDPDSYKNWVIEAAEKDKLTNVLFRFLTDLNMETVWPTILSQPPLDTNPNSNRLRTEPEISLWNTICWALTAFDSKISSARTTAQKTKDLTAISAKTKTLLNAIDNDPATAEIAKRLITNYLSKVNLEFRESKGEIPPWYEYDVPMTLQSDCHEAWVEIRANSNKYDSWEASTDKYLWHKRPLLERLRYWAEEAEKTDLVDLLHFFIKWIDFEAKQPQEIKHPGRGKSALKSFLIRRINKHMQWYYGQPLDEAVAQIVTTILDLSEPLTRDDVRPYIKDSGKISDQSN